jgi:hypothetical protein
MTNIQVPLGAEKIGEISKEVRDVLGLDFAVESRTEKGTIKSLTEHKE